MMHPFSCVFTLFCLLALMFFQKSWVENSSSRSIHFEKLGIESHKHGNGKYPLSYLECSLKVDDTSM